MLGDLDFHFMTLTLVKCKKVKNSRKRRAWKKMSATCFEGCVVVATPADLVLILLTPKQLNLWHFYPSKIHGVCPPCVLLDLVSQTCTERQAELTNQFASLDSGDKQIKLNSISGFCLFFTCELWLSCILLLSPSTSLSFYPS